MTGVSWGDRHRKKIGSVLATLNCLAMFLGIFAALGMTQTPSLLQFTHWVYGEVVVQKLPDAALHRFPHLGENISRGLPVGIKVQLFFGVNMRLNTWNCRTAENSTLCQEWLGLLHHVEVEPGLFYEEMRWGDSQACSRGLGSDVAQNQKICQNCQGAQFSNFALVMGVVTQWPTLLTNLQRSTRFGDINCQATMGVLTNIWGLVMTLLAFGLYGKYCYTKLPDNVSGLKLQWKFGLGYWCLLAATLVKVPDGIGHFIIPTPRQRWTSPKTSFASAAEYMALREEEAVGPKQESMGEASDRPLKQLRADEELSATVVGFAACPDGMRL